MSGEYDNGYNSDFKRNSNVDNAEEMDHPQDGDDASSKLNEKAGEYMRELLSEKTKLNTSKFPISTRLIDQEVTKVQASGRVPLRDSKYVDVYREKPVKVVVKVLVPIKEHPRFNFVGKLLGPKGNTMKQLQEETMCKMAVLGKGSMRDRQKEEEYRNSLDPKYSHLTDELHVEISALAPPAEAHARIAYALAEVKKYLQPDSGEVMRPPMPMREMIDRDGQKKPPLLQTPPVSYGACTVSKRSLSYGQPILTGPPRPVGPPGRPPRMGPPMPPRLPAKSKVISILDRARTAMETSSYSYDDYPSVSEPPVRAPARAPPQQDYDYYERDRYYEDDYYKEPPSRDFKLSREVGTRRAAPPPRHMQRQSPYARPQQK